MQVSVTFRNTGSESWFKDYVTERLSRIQKFIDKPVEAHVVLSVEKFRNVAEINIMAKGINLVGKEEAKDMQLAIDNVIDKIERQIKKHKEKSRERKSNANRAEESGGPAAGSAAFEEESRPKVVETRKVVLKPMSLEEAILEMEGSRNRFVIYRDANSEKISVVYRRDDGDFALLEANS
ncbi:MAG TPA: ribosome-associated translation inhibitor RaiA [Syntrophales bacterium]|nr:ribosome-associated translation inhibitor RaiA [Syntrophales bacterium]